MIRTKEYYNKNAEEYIAKSFVLDLSELHSMFLSHIPKRGRIIDLGCGSCRDTMAFLERGYSVDSLDGAQEICKLAYEKLEIKVINENIEDWNVKKTRRYDGIWACASLHHLEENEFVKIIDNLPTKLSDKGICYFSVKSGILTGYDELGRFQQNYSVDNIQRILSLNKRLTILKIWNNNDIFGRNEFQWINVIIQNRGGI